MQTITIDMTFAEAWPIWYKAKAQTISEKSQKCHREYIRQLLPFFGAINLREITFEHPRTRQRSERLLPTGAKPLNPKISRNR